jgi:hypothetical protein
MDKAIIEGDVEDVKILIQFSDYDPIAAMELASEHEQNEILCLLSADNPNIMEYPSEDIYHLFEDSIFCDNDNMFQEINNQDIKEIKKLIAEGNYDSHIMIEYSENYPYINNLLKSAHKSVCKFFKSSHYREYIDDNEMTICIISDDREEVKRLIKRNNFNHITAMQIAKDNPAIIALLKESIMNRNSMRLRIEEIDVDNDERNEPEDIDIFEHMNDDIDKLRMNNISSNIFEHMNDDTEDKFQGLTMNNISSSLSPNTDDMIKAIRKYDYNSIKYYIIKNNYDRNKVLIEAINKPYIMKLLLNANNGNEA